MLIFDLTCGSKLYKSLHQLANARQLQRTRFALPEYLWWVRTVCCESYIARSGTRIGELTEEEEAQVKEKVRQKKEKGLW